MDIPSEWNCILPVPHLSKHVNHSWWWCHIDLCSFEWNFIILRIELTSCMFFHVQFCTLNVHINICFCMGFRRSHICTNVIHILMGFCHVHLCTNEYPYYSCMGFRHVHFCTNDYPYSYGFLSCTSLYGWLSVSLCMGFHHAHFCTNDYPFLLNGFSSMHISVWMTIHFFFNAFSSCTFLYKWLPFIFECVFVMHI